MKEMIKMEVEPEKIKEVPSCVHLIWSWDNSRNDFVCQRCKRSMNLQRIIKEVVTNG